MSTTIDQAFVKQFEEEVHQAYQRMGSKLRNTVRVKNGVQGSSTVFQKVGKGSASTKARHGKVPVMNVDHTPIECQLLDFYAGDWVDHLDELKINIDERQVLANAGAFALGRKTDELIITALGQTTNTAGAGTDGLTKAKVLEAFEMLGEMDVPDDGQRYAVIGWKQWSDLLEIAEFANADFVGAGRAAVARHPGQALAGHPVAAAFGPRAECQRAQLLLVPPQRDRPRDRPGGHDRRHLARRPGRALRLQLDEPGRLPDRRRRRHRDALPGELSMAYDSSNLSALTYANGFTLWHYKTNGSRRTSTPPATSTMPAMLRVGDFIFANASMTGTRARVGGHRLQRAGVVDVADITGLRRHRHRLRSQARGRALRSAGSAAWSEAIARSLRTIPSAASASASGTAAPPGDGYAKVSRAP